MYLLDTNVVSELRKAGAGRADANVVASLSRFDASVLYISAITLMELELGVRRLERRDGAQAGLLRAWIETRVIPEFSGRTLVVDAAIARRCAQLHVPDPCAERDAYIAATALVHGMTLVTRNIDDFSSTGVALLNPWDGAK